MPADAVAFSHVTRNVASVAARPEAVRSVQAFTSDLYRRLAVKPGNLVCSPYSVTATLAMTRNGAVGRTAEEMDRVLHAPDPRELDSGLNSLTQLIEGRAGRARRADGTTGTVSLDVANSLWGQHDTEWDRGFLDELARNHGAGMRLVDYTTDAAAARKRINAWTADQTHDKIPQLIPPGVLDGLTRLVLVNAIYLKAPWEETFDASATSRARFHRPDGPVEVDMMSRDLSRAAFASGPGWRAGRLAYAGGELAMAVVIPEEGRLEEVEAALDGPGLAGLLASFEPVPAMRLEMPRWKFRTSVSLRQHLSALGMPTAFDETRADFSGMTAEDELHISHVLHEAHIAVDEEGTEAAAATAVIMRTTSAGPRPVVLRADRPFLFIMFDIETATPLFIGRVSDPTVSA